MGIYGHKFDSLIYNSSLTVLENTINENELFLESLTDTIVTESVGSVFKNIFGKVKKVVDTILEFLKSIPRKIRDLVFKIFNKDKQVQKEIDKKKQEPELIFDKEAIYDGELYDYGLMIGSMFDRSNFMMSEDPSQYKSFLLGIKYSAEEFQNNFGLHINGNYFSHCKTKEEWTEYINSDKYKDKFKLDKKNNTAGYLNDHKSEINADYVKEVESKATDYTKSWEKIGKNIEDMLKDDDNLSGDLLKTLSSNKTSADKIKEAGLEEESLRYYLLYANLSAYACRTVMTKAVEYTAKAEVQNLAVNNFLLSCWKKNPNYKGDSNT